MSLKDDLKQQAEKAAVEMAMLATLSAGPLQTVAAYQVAPEDAEKHRIELAEELRADRAVADELLEGKDKTDQEAAKVYAQFNSPVVSEVSEPQTEGIVRPQEDFSIGNWSSSMRYTYEVCSKAKDKSLSRKERLLYGKEKIFLTADMYDKELYSARDIPERPDDLIDRSRITFSEGDGGSRMAFFFPTFNEITVYKYSDWNRPELYNNPIAETGVLIHENVHKDHYNFDGQAMLFNSPINAGKGDRLTETVAFSAQYLHAAHQYSIWEKEGVKEINYKDVWHVDRLFEEYSKLPKEDRPDMVAYLESKTFQDYHVTAKLSDLREDYQNLKAENKPAFVDWLKENGVQTLQVRENVSISDVLQDYVHWKGEGKRPTFDDYVESLDNNGVQYDLDGRKISTHVFAAISEEDEKVLSAGGEKAEALLKDEIYADKNITSHRPVSVEAFRGGVTFDNSTYLLPHDKAVEKITQLWDKVQDKVEKGEDWGSELQESGLASAGGLKMANMPIEDIFKEYPGLKEVVKEHGFDPKDTESVARVVKAASDYWHEAGYVSVYENQMLCCAGNGSDTFSRKPWSEQMQILKDEDKVYQEVSERMLKDVYIGYNTTVDLSGCREMLDTLPSEEVLKAIETHNQAVAAGDENAKEAYFQSINVVSLEEMKEVNAYLEGKGLKTDVQKMKYMAQYLDNEGYRRGENRDAALTEILLSYNSRITYQDGLSVEHKSDGQVTAMVEGKTYNLTSYLEAETDVKAMEKQPEHTGGEVNFVQYIQNMRDR